MSAPYVLTITDETAMGELIGELKLPFDKLRVCVKDIIIERVRYEVETYNSKVKNQYYGLVQPTKAEKVLNKFKLDRKAKVDVDKQVAVALRAFEENDFFLLVGDIQVETLEQQVDIEETKTVSFIKLTPLVGG